MDSIFCTSHVHHVQTLNYYYGILQGYANYTFEREGVRIIFSTLWTKISPEMSFFIKNGLYDYRVIRDGSQFFSVDRCNELFEENFNYIKTEVKHNDEKQNIVVSHHVPTFKNYPEEYAESKINEAFATNLDSFIESANIHSWVYGHHHRNVPEFEIGNTKMLTNQLGYVRAGEHEGFKRDAIIEI